MNVNKLITMPSKKKNKKSSRRQVKVAGGNALGAAAGGLAGYALTNGSLAGTLGGIVIGELVTRHGQYPRRFHERYRRRW